MTLLLSLLLLTAPASAAKPYDAELARLTTQLDAATDDEQRFLALAHMEDLIWKDAGAQTDAELCERLLVIGRAHNNPSAGQKERLGAWSVVTRAQEWLDTTGPPARERARRERAARKRHRLKVCLEIIGAILLGGLLVVAYNIVGAFAAIHGDEILEGGAKGAAFLFLRHPALLLVPATTTALFSALLANALWRVLGDPSMFTPQGDVVALAESFAYRPESLAAVFLVFCGAMLANTAFLAARVRSGRGEDAGLASGLVDAARVCVPVAFLSSVACAALVGLDRAWRAIGGVIAGFAAAAVESAAMLALNTAVCAMLFERAGPFDAMKRAAEILRPEWRSGLRAIAATTILRGPVVVVPFLCAQVALIPSWVLALLYTDDTTWWNNGGLLAVFFAVFAFAAIFASFILTLAWMLDAAFAAAFYLHATGQKPLPAALAAKFERPAASVGAA